MDIKFLNFNQLRSKAIESPNKVAFMVECFKVLHSDAPPEDLDSKLLGGRLASILTQANKDYCRVLQVMWKTSADRNVKRTEPTRLARVAVKELADKDKGNGK
jgi:hypothetical protein